MSAVIERKAQLPLPRTAEEKKQAVDEEKLLQLQKTKAAYEKYNQDPANLDDYFKEICRLEKLVSNITTDYSATFGNGDLYRVALNILGNPDLTAFGNDVASVNKLIPFAISYRDKFCSFSKALATEQDLLRPGLCLRFAHYSFKKEASDAYDRLYPDTDRNLCTKYRISALAFTNALLSLRAKGEEYHQLLLENGGDSAFLYYVPLLALYEQKLKGGKMPELFAPHEADYKALSITEADLADLQHKMLHPEESLPATEAEQKAYRLVTDCSRGTNAELLTGLTRFGALQAVGFAEAIESARKALPEETPSLPTVLYFFVKNKAIPLSLLRTDIFIPIQSLQKKIGQVGPQEETKLLAALRDTEGAHPLKGEVLAAICPIFGSREFFNLPNFTL